MLEKREQGARSMETKTNKTGPASEWKCPKEHKILEIHFWTKDQVRWLPSLSWDIFWEVIFAMI